MKTSRAKPRVASVAALCIAAVIACSSDADPDRGAHGELLAELASLEPVRTLAPRLSIPTQHRPCEFRPPPEGTIPQARCEPVAGALPFGRVRDLTIRAAARVRAEVDPDALHTVALIDLLWTDSAGNSLTRSISYLETASRLTDRPAPVLADLAAAYLARAERRQQPRDLLEALDAAARALQAEPGNEAALFNHALALDLLGLDAEASRAWAAFLDVGPRSGWEAEARKRKEHLAQTMPAAPEPPPWDAPTPAITTYAASNAPAAFLFGWNRALGEWGEAVLAGDSAGAEQRLRWVEVLSSELERVHDATLADAARGIRRVSRARALERLAAAHRDYAAARAVYAEVEYGQAAERFAALVAGPEPAEPLRSWARLFQGNSLIYSGRMAEAEQVFRSLVARADTARHPLLAAQARWSLGTVLLRAGRYTDAADAYAAAKPLLERAGERENVGATQMLGADAHFAMGETVTGYALMHRALMTLRPFRGSVWLHNLLYVTAHEAAEDGLAHASVHLQEEGVEVALRNGQPLYAVEARLSRARLLAGHGEHERALVELEAARAQIPHLPEIARGWFGADGRQVEGLIYRTSHPGRAAAALDSVVAYFGALDNPHGLLPALTTRAEVRLTLGDTVGAMSDLEHSTRRLEQVRAALRGTREYGAFTDAIAKVFDRVIMHHAAGGRVHEALQYLERSRAMAAHASATDGARQVVDNAADGVRVTYALIGDTLLVWTQNGRDTQLVRSTIERNQMVRTVSRTRALLEERSHDSVSVPQLAQLYDWLIRPVRDRLPAPGGSLALVADGEISGVPFAALYDRERQRFLSEEHVLRFAPAPSTHVRSGAPRYPGTGRVVVVAVPRSDAAPDLAPLVEAVEEAQLVGALYPDVTPLSVDAADAAALRRALPGAAVLHFAGHAVFDDARPERSFLALAPENGERQPTRLVAAEIESLALDRLDLVVLSACETLRPRPTRSGGFAGLTEAFLAAGAGGVVGSLWRVEDGRTRALMVAFHRAYRAGADPAAALRTAQLELLRSPDPTLRSPAAWAGFRYAGH